MLAALDPTTLGLAVALTLFTVAAQAVFFLCSTKPYPGSRYWAVSLVLQAFAFLALLLRGRIPDVVSIVGLNYGIFLSMCLFYDGLARFHGRNGHRLVNRLNHGVALAVVPALLYYTFIDASVNARIALFNAFQLYISARSLILLAQLRHVRKWAPHLMLAAVYLALAALSLVRTYLILDVPPMTYSMKEDLGLRLMMLIDLVLVTVLWFSIMLMTHTRIEQELEDARTKAELDSRTDSLTGAWNRHHFEAEARREIERASRYGHPASLLMLDIDHFKMVNDQHGHLVGDEVLKELARCAGTSIRASDLLCRWGGEEFVVLMPASDDDAAKAADKLRQTIEQHGFPTVGTITVSIGVAQLRTGDDLGSWMRRADNALYRAKARGRNRVEKENPDLVFSSPMSLRWMPGFTCGHAELDAQHQALFDRANRLLEHCGTPGDKEVAGLMEDLLREAERHFRYEEEVLRGAGYPRLGEHVAEHERLLQEGNALLNEFRDGKVPASALSSFAVRELAVGHIAEEDVSYVSFINARSTEESGVALREQE